MTKKDVLEIRHRFSPATCSIGKICGCYVDGDRKKVAYIDSAFLSLPEEESFKYFDIFKKKSVRLHRKKSCDYAISYRKRI